jgi:hypothetical protein
VVSDSYESAPPSFKNSRVSPEWGNPAFFWWEGAESVTAGISYNPFEEKPNLPYSGDILE